MGKPPEQDAKIIDLFPKRKRPPKQPGAMGAKVVKLSSIRRSRGDEAPDISPGRIQDAQIIEIPDMPSKIRQDVSKLVNDIIAIAKKFKHKEGDNPQNYKEIAEKIVELLDEAYKRPDDKPRDNSTKELGVCILTLAVFNPETIEVLNTPNVLAELERIIGLSRRPAHFDRQAASMAEVAWQQLTYKPEDTEDTEDTDDNAGPEPPSIT